MINKSYEFAIFKSFLRDKSERYLLSMASTFSILGISIAVAVIITVMSVMNGFQIEVKEKILNLLPHASITYSQPSKEEGLEIVLKNNPKIKSYSAAIDQEIIIIGNQNYAAVQLKAFTPSDKAFSKKVSDLIVNGDLSTLQDGTYNISIGERLSRDLNVSIGDTITLMTQDKFMSPLGSLPRMKKFNISSIFQSGIFDFDQRLVFINISDAQRLFQLKNKINGYDVEFQDPEIARYEIRTIAFEAKGDFFINDWTKQNPNFFRSLELTKKIIFMVLIIILAVASFNIISTLIMMVKDKRSTIGIIRTMGVNKNAIFRIFFSIGLFLGIVGSLLGTILGIVITLNLNAMIQFFEKIFNVSLYQAEVYFLNQIPVRIDWAEIMVIFWIVVLLSIISSVIPSYRASRLNPGALLKIEK